MANRVFRGDAMRLTDTWTFLISSNTLGHTFTLTRNGKSYTVTADGVLTTDQLAAALQALLAASTEPEFLEYTWTVNTSTITGTLASPTTVLPATFTKSGTGTSTLTNTVVGQGPNSWIASNFDTGLPANGDTVYITSLDVDILHNLDQSGVTLTRLEIPLDYEGSIGLARRNEDGTEYAEDREKYLKISATTVILGNGSGNGSDRLQLNTGTNQTEIIVHGSGTSDDVNYHPVRIRGSHASNVLRIFNGAVDVAPYPEDTAQFSSIVISSGFVRTSNRVTLATLEMLGNAFASITTDGTIATVQMENGGTVLLSGNTASATNAITTCNVLNGRLDFRNSGKIGTLVVGPNGIADFTNCPFDITVGLVQLSAGATYLDPNYKVSETSPILLDKCGIQDVTIIKGKDIEITFTTP